MKKSYVIGLGAPCTGTGYTAKTLQNSGLDIPHEGLGNDGVVYWVLAARDGTHPINHVWYNSYDWSKIDWETSKVFQVARSPLNCLNSIAGHSKTRSAPRFMWAAIEKSASKDWEPVSRNFSSFVNSANLLMAWSDLVQNSHPGMIYRVDRPEDNEKLSDFLGVEIKPYLNKKHNSKGNSNIYKYTYEHFKKCPNVGSSFADWCDWLGYPEDAKKVRSVL